MAMMAVKYKEERAGYLGPIPDSSERLYAEELADRVQEITRIGCHFNRVVDKGRVSYIKLLPEERCLGVPSETERMFPARIHAGKHFGISAAPSFHLASRAPRLPMAE